MVQFTDAYMPMMTSSNENIFRVTGPLCGEFTGPGEFPTQRPVTRSFNVFFDLRLNKRLSKQPWGLWFETLPWSLWRHCNATRPNQSLEYKSPRPVLGNFMFSVRFCVPRRRHNNFYFSRQNRLCVTLDISIKKGIGLENVLGDFVVTLAQGHGSGTD